MRRILTAALVLAAGFALAAGGARAEQAKPLFNTAQRAEIVEIVRQALKNDPTILRDAVSALQEEDENVKQAAAKATIGRIGPALTRTQGDPVAGNPSGDVTVVEFYDLRCPYCRRMLPVLAELLHGDPKLRLVYKDFPILGPGSVLGAKAVLAAQKQGGYAKLHDLIMAGPPTITEDSLRQDAERAGLDWTRLRHDMDDPEIAKRIAVNMELARQLGIEGTPAYVVGTKLIPGAAELADLRAAVAAARAAKGG